MRSNLRRVFLLPFMMGLTLPAQARQPNLHLKETTLGVLPGTVYAALQTSPGNRHVFSMILLSGTLVYADFRESGAWLLYRDGVLVGRYDGEQPVVFFAAESYETGVPFQFSADGEHYAFAGARDGKEFVVVDGIEGPRYDKVGDVHLNAAGTSVAYVVGDGDVPEPEQRLVLDGKVGPSHHGVRIRGFSPDGRHIAYEVESGRGYQFFLDTVPQIEGNPPIATSPRVTFSPDWRHFAFVGGSEQGRRVVLDGRTVGTYPEPDDYLYFSPDSQHLAFYVFDRTIRSTNPVSVVVDGAEHPLSGELGDYGLGVGGWSPDSRHFVYVVKRNSQLHIVLDGVESPASSRFGGNGRFLQDGQLAYSAFDGMSWTTYIGSERIPDMRLAGITPDGVHRAFLLDDSDVKLQVDGKRYDSPGAVRSIGFSKTGKHFFYSGGSSPPQPGSFAAWKSRNEAPTIGKYDAVDGVVVPSGTSYSYQYQNHFVFTDNEKHFAIIDNTNIWVDNVPILPTDVRSPHCARSSACFSFDGNDRFHTFAIRGNRVVRIDGRF